MNDLVSIIIPVFNCGQWIERCILSALNQTYNNLQIIIINDGSYDESECIIQEYANRDDRIIYINKKNEGVSKARNKGLEVASGDYVTFLDADDTLNEKMIEKLLFTVKKYDADIAFCFDSAWQKLDGEEMVICAEDFEFQKEYSSLVAWGGLYKKSVTEGIRFDEKIYVSEDILFKSRAIKNARTIAFLFEPLYNYYIYETSACHGNYNKKKLTEIEAWKKITEIFQGTKTEISAKKTFNQRCKYIVCSYWDDSSFYNDDFTYCMKQYKKSYLEIYRYLNFRSKLTGSCFYVAPRLTLRIKRSLRKYWAHSKTVGR